MKEDFVVQFPRLVKSLRALTKVILVYTPTAYDIPLRGIEVDFRKRKSLILLIRRAMRATFPDMGRLPLSELPSIDGKLVQI